MQENYALYQRPLLYGYPMGVLAGLLIPSGSGTGLDTGTEKMAGSWLETEIRPALRKTWLIKNEALVPANLTANEVMGLEYHFAQSFYVGSRSIIEPRFDATLLLFCNYLIGEFHSNSNSLMVTVAAV
ncbi:MAG: hypothetical protein IT342_04885 [Candidatus Melainabacteria bacterium]|nr:hypothetical protein [Candidatus Melainabacteria bacterium]